MIDEAEIPTFQARLSIDANGDGVISNSEAEVERLAACPRLVPDLDLTIAGSRLSLVEFGAGLSFPPGTAGLSTMRLVCEFTAGLPAPLAANTTIGFDDTSSAGRIGWHEVVVTGSGVSLVLGHLPPTSVSNRLRLYPPKLIPHPLAINNVTFEASPGGPVTPYVEPTDALPLVAAATPAASSLPDASTSRISSGGGAQPSTGPDAAVGALGAAGGSDPGSGTEAVPGGVVGVDIAGLIGSSAITPLVLVTSLLAALMLGAGHALTPGHGKTLMGAYLVGSRADRAPCGRPGAGRDRLPHARDHPARGGDPPGPRRGPGAVQHGRSDRVRADRPRDWRLAAAWPGACLPNRRAVFGNAGFASAAASNITDACDAARSGQFQVIVTVPSMRDGSWHRLVDVANLYEQRLEVILLASNFDLTEWAGALNDGAFDVLNVPNELPNAAKVATSAFWAAYFERFTAVAAVPFQVTAARPKCGLNLSAGRFGRILHMAPLTRTSVVCVLPKLQNGR